MTEELKYFKRPAWTKAHRVDVMYEGAPLYPLYKGKVYDTPITDDVLGFLTSVEVLKTGIEIYRLK